LTKNRAFADSGNVPADQESRPESATYAWDGET
jgi:hypothetical protein